MTTNLLSSLEFLCRIALGSTFVLTIGLFAVWVCRKQSSATRHLIATLTCVALLLLPCTLMLLPSWELGILDADSVLADATGQRHSGFETSHDQRNHQPPHSTATNDPPVPLMPESIASADPTMVVSPVASSGSGSNEITSSQSVSSQPGSFRDWTSLLPFVIYLYMLGVAVGLIRLLADHRSIRRIILQSETLPEPVFGTIVKDCGDSWSLYRRVEVRLTSEITVPVVAGIVHPMILLPHASMQWSADRLRAVIGHELAHVQRHDVFIQLLSRIAALLYWPQPLIYGLIAIMRNERETACDDLALFCSNRRAEYARHLLEIAASLGRRDRFARSALAMARCSNVERRIEAVLSTTRRRKPPARSAVAGMLTSMMLFLLATTIVNPFSGPSRAEVVAEIGETGSTENEVVPAAAEEKTHTFTGRVLLPNGEPAVGAVVRSVEETRNKTIQSMTNSDGRFSIRLIATVPMPLIVKSESGDLSGFIDFPRAEGISKRSFSREVNDIQLKRPRCVNVQVVDGEGAAVTDAVVIVQGGYGVVERSRTNEQGKVSVSYPDGLVLQTIGAVKGGAGCDYRAFEHATPAVDKSHPSKLPQGFEGDVKFVLNGVRTTSVKVIGPDKKPLAGVNLHPWLMNRPDRGDYWNLPDVAEFRRYTNEDGIAVFEMIPIDQVFGIEIFPRIDRDDWFVIGNREDGNPSALVEWADGDAATIHVAKKVIVGGHVRHSDGRLAADVTVVAAGSSKQFGHSRETAQSDAEGQWKMLVRPHGYYLFVVQDDQLAADPQAGIIVRETATPMNLDFVLQPARRVFGKVTGPTTAETYVMLQQVAPDYYSLPDEDRLPNPNNSNNAVSAFTQTTKMASADGSFEFMVGPGDFIIWSPDRKTQKFTITDELEKEFNFHIERPQRGAVKVNVVKADDSRQPVPNARIAGVGTKESRGLPLTGVTGEDGSMERERELLEMLVLAITTDNQFAGMAVLGPDDKDLTVEVSPAIQMTGRLVNSENEPILEKQQLEYQIPIKFGGGLSTWSVTTYPASTDAKGRFILEGLCDGLEYDLHLVDPRDENGQKNRRFLKTFRPDDVDVDLGDVKVPPP